ncbi:MAG: hypothetical protein ACKO2N_17250, partial [Tabrizicola sp.]
MAKQLSKSTPQTLNGLVVGSGKPQEDRDQIWKLQVQSLLECAIGGAVGPSQQAQIRHAGGVRPMRTRLRLPNPGLLSGSEKATPLGKSGGAGGLVV